MSTTRTRRQCYAEALGGCKGQLSREHFVSHSILKQVEVDGVLNVDGLPLGGTKQGRKVSARSLSAKFLCQAHNSALSALDVAGEQFLMFFFNANKALYEGTLTEDMNISVDGTLVERWLLKYACGLISSGNAGMIDGGVAERKPPPPQLLRVLFGNLPLDGDLGLYSSPKGITSSLVKFSLSPTWKHLKGDSKRTLSGVELVNYGLQNVLKLVADYPPTEGIDFSQAVFRPDFFQLSRVSTGRKARIKLDWPRPSKGIGLEVPVVTKAEETH